MQAQRRPRSEKQCFDKLSTSGFGAGGVSDYDAIILGAGAAGLFCAATAGQRGKRVLLLDHNDAPGKKILISGGGRCNFTNLHANCETLQNDKGVYLFWDLRLDDLREFIEEVRREAGT